MTNEDYIYGIRAIIEAIEAGKEIDKIFIKKGLRGDLADELLTLVKEHGLVAQFVPIERLNRITRKNHQGAIAMLSAVTYYRLDHVIAQLYEEGVTPLIMVLDSITDVRNFGAIARTCECAAVDAIVIPAHGSVSVGSDAIKTSAGALHRVPVCKERNLADAVRLLRESGYKVVAASEKADINYTQADYTTPTAIVMGAEDTGITPAVLRQCDTMVSIPLLGHIGSLNVSVAAGVMLYEVVRQRLEANIEVI